MRKKSKLINNIHDTTVTQIRQRYRVKMITDKMYVEASDATVLSTQERKTSIKEEKKKSISVVSGSCRFISLSIQTHRSPLNCFIEQ